MCDKCKGKGYAVSTEVVEHFGGAYRMGVFYTCDCLLDRRCPKCDNDLTDDDMDGNTITGKVYCDNCDSWWEVV